MHLKKILIFVILVVSNLLFSGCWDSLDINDKELATLVGVDMESGDKVFVVEFANLKSGHGGEKSSKSDKEEFTMVRSQGKTYVEARQDLDNKLPKPLFLGTVRILVFTKDMATNGVAEYMYRVRNLFEYRKALRVVTTSKKSDEFQSFYFGSPISAGHTIEELLEKLNKTGKCIDSSASEILERLSSDHVCFVLPDINSEGESIILSGYSIIHNSMYTALIPVDEIKGINFLLNENVEYFYTIPFNDHILTVEIKLKKKKIEPLYENKEISFKAEFEFESIVKYMDINDGLTEEIQREIKQKLANILAEDIRSAIEKSQKEIECDYLDFHEIFRIKYPNEVKELDWCEEYLDADMDVKVRLTMDPGGDYDYNPKVK